MEFGATVRIAEQLIFSICSNDKVYMKVCDSIDSEISAIFRGDSISDCFTSIKGVFTNAPRLPWEPVRPEGDEDWHYMVGVPQTITFPHGGANGNTSKDFIGYIELVDNDLTLP
jgi:hypothetical protein